MVPTDDLHADYPPELIDRIVEQAGRDADLAAHFLDEIGLATASGATRPLPGELLFELGAAMRVLAWEMGGLDPTRLGLPTAREAILRVLTDATRRIVDPTDSPSAVLSRDVFRVAVNRLAWVGPRAFRAEILLDLPDEDALVDAMARFLWDRRHATAGSLVGEAP